MAYARIRLMVFALALCAAVPVAASRADIVSVSPGGAHIRVTDGPAGNHYTLWRQGRLTGRAACVSLGLVTDPQPPYRDREQCACIDGSRFSDDPRNRNVVFLGLRQWCQPTRLPNIAGNWRAVSIGGQVIHLRSSGGGYAYSNFLGTSGTVTVEGDRFRIRWSGSSSGELTSTQVGADRIVWSNGQVWQR